MDRKHQRLGTQVVELAGLSTKVPCGWHTLGPDLSTWLVRSSGGPVQPSENRAREFQALRTLSVDIALGSEEESKKVLEEFVQRTRRWI